MQERKIFSSVRVEFEFRTNGYCILPEIADEAALDELRALSTTVRSRALAEFHVSSWHGSNDHAAIHRAVSSLVGGLIGEHIMDYRPVLGCFAMKPSGESDGGIMGIHQDWSFTDESWFDPVSVWLPLQDVDERNGCLEFVPGSHEVFRNVRGFDVTPPIDYLHPELLPHMRSVPIRAGDAIVLHSRVVHRSGLNQSGSPREVAMLAMIPREAPVMAYARRQTGAWNELDVHHCPDDFYLHYDVFKGPDRPAPQSRIDPALTRGREDALVMYSERIERLTT